MIASKDNSSTHEPIAIIGQGCRFPGEANSPAKLWQLLRQPRDLLTTIPDSRFSPHSFYHQDGLHHGTSNVTESYILSEDHRLFDAQFFGIKNVEASSIDPQQRLLLETVYESLESAGLSIASLQGSDTAVYVGLMTGDYSDLLNRDANAFPTYFATGTARSIVSNRVSYFFDWHGPSMTIDTACSSSIVALHQAVQALRAGDCKVAIAAGTNLILGPEQYIAESKLKMLSPRGRSSMWDRDADGYARGDGVASVVLKTLSEALRAGDVIECIVRETGINQDGKTKGITMPSPVAQAALIRATYAKAGLDLDKPSDRPQFFEAHGTGTPAGDPIEAEAISTAFFGGERDKQQTLYVGSIKTVVGHTEGTAGLAAVLKASLALQNGVVPPNLLFNSLNPAVEPFYKNLQIPTEAKNWPPTHGGPRRISVNSFGFGGANGHAILERYETQNDPAEKQLKRKIPVFTPFTFSAATERALAANLAVYVAFLSANPSINLGDLSWTLTSRRSALPSKITFSASSVADLRAQLENAIEGAKSNSGKLADEYTTRSTVGPSTAILGIFTGQGAQWAAMGRALVLGSDYAKNFMVRLEERLARLPDRPSWSLIHELKAEGSGSRVGEATISQPLCTAIQVLLVELLKKAGIYFKAVVGHSSGEIAAAYAAGIIASPEDAICIAYYRGLHSKLASGPSGQKGAMLAVGTSLEDAQELCALPLFAGRITVAASNSPASVTLSGDDDAIHQAKEVFEEEKKFARLLRIDKAYHSHHMLRASEAYLTSLRTSGIQPLRSPNPNTSWFSSVTVEQIHDVSYISDTYWNDNMVNPVLFSQAVELAVTEIGPFDVAIEVGPHPALQGPVKQTIEAHSGDIISYTGTLQRGLNDIESVSNTLAYLWKLFGENAVSFSGYDHLISGGATRRLLKDLPAYSWDHDRVFWHESRVSKAYRTRKEPTHEILGTRSVDGAEDQAQWRNILRPKEIPWISGHQIQGQMVFPGAGYIAAAIESIRSLAGSDNIRLIELENIEIGQAIAFDDEDSSVETLFSVTNIDRTGDDTTAKFSFYSDTGHDSLNLVLNCNGRLRYKLGDSSPDVLPSRSPGSFNLLDVSAERFYDSLDEVGYQYSGSFKALTALRRKLGTANGRIIPAISDSHAQLLIHPATLDAAIQSIILAFCWPGDGRLWSIHVPTNIQRVRINPYLCLQGLDGQQQLHFDAVIAGSGQAAIDGDVDIFTPDGLHTLLQLEGMRAKPFSEATAINDFHLFSQMIWDRAEPDGDAVAWDGRADTDAYELAYTFERVAYFYLRTLDETISDELRANFPEHQKSLFNFVDNVLTTVEKGKHQYIKKQWASDTHAQIISLIESHPDSIDLRIMHTVGEHLPAVVRGETTMLEYMLEDNMLNNYYVNALGFREYTKYLARMVGQIAHRNPHMHVLEIGAGTGGATKSVLKELGQTFANYVFTDISSGFFEKAQTVFQSYSSKISFKTLNIENDPVEQNFEDNSFDLVIASLVLHATVDLEETLKNARRLLKPGGHLLMLEITNNGQARLGFVFGSLPGWWLGRDDGRVLSPCITAPEWDALLRKSGFAGIETITPDLDPLPYPLSVIAAQATDDRVAFLRQPLLSSDKLDFAIPQLTIFGGVTSGSLQLLGEIIGLTSGFVENIHRIDTLDQVANADIPYHGSVISLIDLDEPIFQSISAVKLKAIKAVFEQSKSVLWITRGARNDNPYSSMTIGFGRTLLLELPHLQLQFLDLGAPSKSDAHNIAEAFLRFEAASAWQHSGYEIGALSSPEPELALDNGNQLVPRLKLDPTRNARYNSAKRHITTELQASTSVLSIEWQNLSINVRAVPEWEAVHSSRDLIHLEVGYSSLQAVNTVHGEDNYVISGSNAQGQNFITLSSQLKSKLELPQDQLMPIPSTLDEHQAVEHILYYIIAKRIFAEHSYGGTIVILDPSLYFGILLERLAHSKGVVVTILTTLDDVELSSWVKIHPQAPARAIRVALPQDTRSFVNLSRDKGLAGRIIAGLPPHSNIHTWETLLSKSARHARASSTQALSELLSEALRDLNETPEKVIADINIVSLNELGLKSLRDNDNNVLKLVDWRKDQVISVTTQSVDSIPLFTANKTYWLVGLTGGLGQSLCRWMVEHGARYVVLSSRNPKVDERWLESLVNLGATIKILKNDVTSKQSVQQAYDEITTTLPPLAGIAQGAMVLHDTLFVDLDIEKAQKVLRPKVDGSRFLQEVIGDKVLDFFVFFSSVASVTGNGGQSHYAAANMFMVGLAAQRRKRGLAASVIHIGAIIGNGYITRELTQAQQNALRSYGNVWMSEQDFHQIFAEAVVCSSPRSEQHYEFMTGLRLIDAKSPAEDRTTWFDNPRFGHLILHQEGFGTGASTTSSGAPIKVQLLEAVEQQQVVDILRLSFINKLKSILQMSSEEAQLRFASLDSGADELGIDSLIAVEIRTWFLKELTVDMPVLKILGGTSIGDLLIFTLEKLPTSLVPNISGEFDTAVAATQLQKPPAEIKVLVKDAGPLTAHQPSSAQTLHAELVQAKTAVTSLPVPMQQSHVTSEISSTKSSQLTTAVVERSEGSIGSWDALSESDLNSSTGSADNPVQRTLNMSFGQSRFYFLREYLEDQTTFNITCSIRLKGKIDIPNLERAVKHVGTRHSALRTAFFLDDNGQPKQGILSSQTLHLEHRHIQDESEIVLEFQRMKDHIFALERGQLMRIRLLSLSPTLHQVIIGYHHINMDGISLEILLGDLQRAYDGDSLKDRVLQYEDFSVRQLREYEAGNFKSELAFWRKEFADPLPPLPILPLSRKTSREPLTQYATYRVDLRLPDGLAKRIEVVARKFKATPFHFYLAVFKIFLFRQLDIGDLAIGIADGNRNDSDTMNSIGFYLNLLPLRFQQSHKQVFSDSLKEAKTKAYSALANARVPFDILLAELNVPRSATYSPLFQVFLNYRQGVEENRPFCGCETDGLQFSSGRTAYDITVDIVDNVGGSPLIAFEVQQSLYTESDGQSLLKSFTSLLDAFSRNPSQDVSKATLYDQGDIREALTLGRGPIIDYKWAHTLSHQVDRITNTHSSKTAISDSFGNQWTYRQLAERTDIIASGLLHSKVTAGSVVGVFQEPTSDWVASLLAIFRIGAIYVPLDLRTPVSRLALIVQDSQPMAIIVHQQTVLSVSGLSPPPSTSIINVSNISSYSVKKIANNAVSESIAVHIFTSGTTGTPKGITLTNAGLVHQIEVTTKFFGIGVETVLQQTAFSFDMHIWQVFWALGNGGKLLVAPKAARGDSGAILDLVVNEGVTLATATPSEQISWLRLDNIKRLRKSNLRTTIAGGEQVTRSLLQAFADLDKPDLRLFNAYGPSEITICSHAVELNYRDSAGKIDQDHVKIPVGNSLPDYTLYIVDRDFMPLPTGVPGEVVIGGSNVSPGYLGNKALTAEKFLSDKFSPPELATLGWKIIHRTGDRGRLLPNGALVVEGRIDGDTQIKLRGIRIDLRDIEETVIRISEGAVQDAVVSVRSFASERFLVAHVVVSDTGRFATDGFLNSLRGKLPLPQSMIPALIIPLDRLPIAPSGKISRRIISELPLPPALTTVQSTQLTDLELKMKEIWVDVLSPDIANQFTIDSSSDFFHVGGNSLLLVQLQKQIQQETGVKIPLVLLFESSTLGSMAAKIDSELIGVDKTLVELLDWDLETRLTPGFFPVTTNDVPNHSFGTVRVVILTGATGFLGRAILAELLEDRNIEKVHCIAIRSASGKNSLPRTWRVEVHSGDLALPDFGLDNSTSDRIFGEADAIIHNGADVSFLKTYQSLKITNVGSTKTLLQLSLKHRIPFHYVSSAGVGQLSGHETFGEQSLQAYRPPVDGSAGYISTKWASEQIISRAVEVFPLPVFIHRPSNITGEGSPPLDIMTNLLKFSRKIGMVPKFKAVQGYLNFIPVGEVAVSIVQEVLNARYRREESKDENVVYRNHIGDSDIPIAKMRRALEKSTGRKFQTRSLNSWLGEARAAGLNEMVAAYLGALEDGDVKVFLPKIIKGRTQ